MEVAALVILGVIFLALVGAVMFLAWTVQKMALSRGEDDQACRSQLLTWATVAQEKALGFADEQREVMRVQRETPAQRNDAPQPPFIPVTVPPMNGFLDGAENRVGG